MDKVLEEALIKEQERQKNNIELIASENYVSEDIKQLQGSILTNKYAEGYPNNRYYGGCQYIDIFEEKAIEYATKLFNCKYANVQPHSGSSANMAVYRALLNHGDIVMGMNLSHGGHLTHGHPLSFSGIDYKIVDYKVDKETNMIDYDEVERIAILKAVSDGYRKGDFKELHIMVGSGKLGMPCFICRQVMNEFFDLDDQVFCYSIEGDHRIFTIQELCTYPFGSDDLK